LAVGCSEGLACVLLAQRTHDKPGEKGGDQYSPEAEGAATHEFGTERADERQNHGALARPRAKGNPGARNEQRRDRENAKPKLSTPRPALCQKGEASEDKGGARRIAHPGRDAQQLGMAVHLDSNHDTDHDSEPSTKDAAALITA
jgi:hypothetical protein